MKLSHVIYKTDDLDKSVEEFRNQGFKVDYGSKYNPHNLDILRYTLYPKYTAVWGMPMRNPGTLGRVTDLSYIVV